MVMAATLLATASITLVVLILNILVSGNLTEVLNGMHIIGATNKDILVYKAFILILVFLFSFLNMVTSIRYNTHLAFLINVAPFNPECSMEYCNKTLLNGSSHYTFGVRSFYLSLPIILWFFDIIFLAICTLLLVCWLWWGDVSDHIIPRQKKVKVDNDRHPGMEEEERLGSPSNNNNNNNNALQMQPISQQCNSSIKEL
eukprot:gene10780-12559_t